MRIPISRGVGQLGRPAAWQCLKRRSTPSTTPSWPQPRNSPPVPKGRRRIIYVISDGKEYGSKAKLSEVIRYLETNKIAVYGTLVGDSARWGEGYVSRIHLPFTMYDNILAKYTLATGGTAGLRAQPERHREELRQDRRRGPHPVHAGLL